MSFLFCTKEVLSEFSELVLDVGNAGADNFADLLTVLEVAKGGHGTDLDFLGNILKHTKRSSVIANITMVVTLPTYGSHINVNLGENNVGVLLNKLLELG